MPPRQQFVVQLGITEVQWNQRLLVSRGHFDGGTLVRPHRFAAKSDFAGPAIMSQAAPAKQMSITGAFRR